MYRYTLRGMNGQIMYSYQPELTFNGLPAKTYQVLASCSTRSGGWTEDYRILELVVLPPWYKVYYLLHRSSLHRPYIGFFLPAAPQREQAEMGDERA